MRSEISIEISVIVYFLFGFLGAACVQNFGFHGAVNFYGLMCLASTIIGLITTITFFIIYWLLAIVFATSNSSSDWEKRLFRNFMALDL